MGHLLFGGGIGSDSGSVLSWGLASTGAPSALPAGLPLTRDRKRSAVALPIPKNQLFCFCWAPKIRTEANAQGTHHFQPDDRQRC